MNNAKKHYLIAELYKLGVYETLKNEPLESVCYHKLMQMLAAAGAVRV